MRYDSYWAPYVPVGQRKAMAHRLATELAKKQNRKSQPIQLKGRQIAKSFWGKAWCDHVESLSDYSNRLPRGRTYVRNGSVADLVITPGKVEAIVAGSSPYRIIISIKKLNKKTWTAIKRDCSSSIDSLLDLLGGRISDAVMHRLTDKKSGCFPSAAQIEMDCDCPDWSICCKHLAAVMYAIGSKLDDEPELLFLLRGVNQEDLIGQAVSKENLAQELSAGSSDLDGEDLGAMFGIEFDSTPSAKVSAKRTKAKLASKGKRARKKTAKGKARAKKKTPVKKTPAKKTVKKKAVKKKVAKKSTKKKNTVKTAAAKKKAVKKATNKKKAAVKKKTSAKRKSALATKKKAHLKKKVAKKKK